jgi:hypothetical protein
MENENDLALLESYAKEMGLYGALTLKDLIESHRRLRELSMRDNDARREELRRGYEAGFKQGEELAIKHNYLSREALRNMTLAELSSILFEE